MAGLAARPLVGFAAAALRTYDQLGEGKLLLLQQSGLRHHLLCIANGDLHSLQRTASLLNNDLLHRLVGALSDGGSHQVHLAVLTAQRYHHRAVNIGVGRITGHHVHGELLVRPHLRAALLVIEADSALYLLGDDAGRIRGAYAGRQNQHPVPHTHAPVRAAISVKCHLLVLPYSMSRRFSFMLTTLCT